MITRPVAEAGGSPRQLPRHFPSNFRFCWMNFM
jgi:hypothetical protein